jgi:hypothetical protein
VVVCDVGIACRFPTSETLPLANSPWVLPNRERPPNLVSKSIFDYSKIEFLTLEISRSFDVAGAVRTR